MGNGIEARILGPLELVVEGERVEVRGGKQRVLLGVLLVHVNDVVSSDQLVESIWNDRSPPSALKTLQALVSRLRSDLGPASAALETHGSGYRLRVEPDRFDAAVFRARVEDGRRSRARGEVEAAAETLRAALALWRGQAFAEFRYEDFAQAEIMRLEELRLAAQEERIAADLELGFHQELIVELESLVAGSPLRERLRGLLMLALYRAGRQAEALEAYDECRRTLAEELGLEPGEALQRLHRQILEHDPSLAPPEPAEARRRTTPTSRRPLLVALVGALVLAVATGAALHQGLGGDEQVEAAGAIALDPESGDVVASVPLGTAPSAVAVGEGGVWVIDADDRTVSQIDAETRALVRTFSTSATPTDVAVGAGSVWIGNAPSAGSLLPTSIMRIDAETRLVVATIDLPPFLGPTPPGLVAGFSRQHIAVAGDAVWVINPDATVSRIDPRSNRRVARIDDVRAENIAVGEGEVWLTEGRNLVEIDPSTNTVARRIPLDAELLAGLAVGAGAVWVADPLGGKLWRVATDRGQAQRAIPLERWVAGVSFGEGAVWVTNEIADAVHRVDPRTGAPAQESETTSPRAVDAGEGGVWLTAASPPSENAALPASSCRGVYYGREGRPDVLIVSNLPLQGAGRQWVQPMVDAIRGVLEKRGFEAGGFSVGYQSCVSSTAQTGEEDFFRCGFVAKGFARNLRVVGVFGSFTSPCSYAQIPIANEAPGGPLAMISPSNTLDDLTEDDDFYPTGTRNYFRLASPNRYEGPALVELAHQLGHERLFVLTVRDEEYGPLFRDGLRTYAERAGVRIVGSATLGRKARTFGPLVGRIAASRPEAVVINGYLTTTTGGLIRELRAALGPNVTIAAPDGFYDRESLRKLARDAAEGMYVSTYGIPNDRLPPAGKQFLRSFAAEHGGETGPDFAASYGAQGAEILLDAIARSDGTRASVTEEVRRTQVRNGILGDVAFDAKGDLVGAPHTILRFTRGDFVVDRVVRVQPSASSR